MLTEQLKQRTRSLHARVEKSMMLRLRNMQSSDDYAELLRLLFGFYKPLEDQISSFLYPLLLPDMRERKKSEALLHDLFATRPIQETIHLSDTVPPIASAAQAIGAAYVLEGSSLGGRIIADLLVKSLGKEIPLSFFTFYGDDMYMMWERFKHAINTIPSDTDEVIDAANRTFEGLNNWIVKHERVN